MNLVGVPDAARILGLSEVRVKQLAKAKRIGTMVAGRYLFSPDELKRFSRKNRPSGRPKALRKKS